MVELTFWQQKARLRTHWSGYFLPVCSGCLFKLHFATKLDNKKKKNKKFILTGKITALWCKQICLLSFQSKGTKKEVWTCVGMPFLTGIHRFLKIYFCLVLAFTSIGQYYVLLHKWSGRQISLIFSIWAKNLLQSTPDNLNLQGKSKKVRVIRSLSYRELEENSRE